MGTEADITGLLHAVARADLGAEERLFDVVHDELRSRARRELMVRPAGQTLDATVLVNEVYMHLFGGEPPAFENRRHFFFAAARAMRDVVIAHARRRGAKRRGGGRRRVSLSASELPARESLDALLDVDEALESLRRHDEGCADIVLLRFFGGLTNEQIADALEIPVARVRREWAYARAWLGEFLRRET